MTATWDDERRARALLTRLAEPGDGEIGAQVRRLGPAEALRQIADGTSTLPKSAGYRTRLRASAGAEADLAAAARCGARLVCPGDLEWPTQLDDLGDGAPIALWVRGVENLRLLAARSVALVGSRAATATGTTVAAEIASSLAERGWCVVSGGAYGVDAAAHRGALAVDGSTVAVLACGVDTAYPRAHDGLFTRILDGGLLVSELPPGCHPTRFRFIERNRVIAALTRGTVVVEAAVRSGALGTAARAHRLHRLVMGVPGPVTSTMSAGVHGWIRDHRMELVTSADDVLALVGPPDPAAVDQPCFAWCEYDALDPSLQRVVEALPIRAFATMDRIAAVAGLEPSTVLGALGELTVLGWAQQSDRGWRKHPTAQAERHERNQPG